MQNTGLSVRELAEEVGISCRKIEQDISRLKESGSLRRIDPAKGGYWEDLK
jgi:predicted DNA-binding transcriptional regulator YafY